MRDGAHKIVESDLEDLRRYLRVNDASRRVAQLQPPGLECTLGDMIVAEVAEVGLSPSSWRVLDHCSVVNRAYAIFEKFVESVLSDWISTRCAKTKFADLPKSIASAYQVGIAEILSSSSSARYSHLSVSDLVSGYNDALRGAPNYRLYPECLIHHRNNFRWSELCDVFSRCGLGDFQGWISLSRRFKVFFDGDSRIWEQVDSKLNELISYRNDAAHGAVQVDEILGIDNLESFIEFVLILSKDILNYVQAYWLDWLIDNEEIRSFGHVSEKFSRQIRIAICEGVTISVGDFIFAKGKGFCFSTKILSLQKKGIGADTVTVGAAEEVGFQFDDEIPLGAKLILVRGPA
jgi:uncharacterized protein (DUF2267 family)